MDLRDALDDLRDVPAAVAGTSLAGTRDVAAKGTGEVSCFRIASLSKSFTSTAVVLAMLSHGVPLDTFAKTLLPDLAADWQARADISVAHVLGQVTGLRESVTAANVAPLPLEEAARLVVRAGSERAPGDRWSYYNGNYFLAGAILSALDGTSFEKALATRLLEPWGMSRTGFGTPEKAVTGWDGREALPPIDYPPARRPSGGLWSSVPDLLSLGEGLLHDRNVLTAIRSRQTQEQDPMAYGLGWALGPSGQMYLNGRLPGYRAAMLLVPDREYVSVILTSQQQALPEAARLLSDLQKPLTGDDLSAALDDFAA
ncbi:serine hydrolase domain-containing protein [Actinoplanes sp. CA-142083]|uniref:serine hydrolase domain-containing protein n=1 Tax=Actinoplanes sp. CA-142083 TaxID=3239903 RepID=UPI003D8E496C